MPIKKLLYGILAVSVLFSLFAALQRHKIEIKNKTVEIVLDYHDFLQFCQKNGFPVDSTLERFKKHGISSIALQEMTPGELYHEGKIVRVRGADLKLYKIKLKGEITYPSTLLLVKSRKVKTWLLKAFSVLLKKGQFKALPEGFLIHQRWSDLAQMELGIAPWQAEKLAEDGFSIDPRISNPGNLNREKLNYLLGTIPLQDHPTVVFSGLRNEILGFDQYIPEVANFFKLHRIFYGYLEVYSPSNVQLGSIELAKLIPNQIVKVQTLMYPPLYRMNPQMAIDIFTLGIHERNVRIVYFHPFLNRFGRLSLMQTNFKFLDGLEKRLKRTGFNFGKAEPFPLFHPSRIQIFISSLGVFACVFLLILIFVDLSVFWTAAGMTAAGILSFISSMVLRFQNPWCFGVAFLAGITFPTYSLLLFSTKKPVSYGKAVLYLVLASCVTVCGGFLVSSLLANNLTMLAVEMFRGVKGVLVFPILFAPWLAWVYRNVKERAKTIKELMTNLKKPFDNPVKFIHLAGLVLLGLAGLIMIIRSGNTTMAGLIPSFEKKLRILLELYLIARPRFKEFLIGHPFFILAACFGLDSEWGFFFFIFGCIGQGDILDSFAHLHTPLYYTLLRTFHGIWIGAVLGGILLFITRKILPESK